MTKEEKQKKLKLISLILLVNTEYARRQPFKYWWETIAFAYEQLWWLMEFKRINSVPTFEKGGIAIVGENRQPEIIVRKS